jgi:hypothetical protein
MDVATMLDQDCVDAIEDALGDEEAFNDSPCRGN